MNQQDKSFLVTFITVMSVLVMIAVAIFLAARMVSLVSLETDDGLRRAAAAETRIKPVGHVVVADASKQQAAVAERSGDEIHAQVCGSCHTAGVLGAPKTGSKEDWEPRLAQGIDTLVDHAVNGFKAMPAKGGDPSLSEEDIKKAIAFMLEESGLEAGEAPTAVAEAAPAPTADRDLAKGEQVYGSACVACHEAGVLGAPPKGDKAAWEPRAEQGMETLFDHAINGFKAMPPKGGNASLSDDEVKDAVAYMLAEADIEMAAAPAAPPEAAAPAPAEAPPTAQEAAPMAAPQAGQPDPIIAAQEAAATALKAAAVALEAAVVAQKIAAAAQESVAEQPSPEAGPAEEAAPTPPEAPAQPEAEPTEEAAPAPPAEEKAPVPPAEPTEEAAPAPAEPETAPTAPRIIPPPGQQDTGAPAEQPASEPEQQVVPSPALPAGQEPVPTLPSQDSAPAPQEPPVEQGATTPEEVVAPLPEKAQEQTAPEAGQPEEMAPADQETTPQPPTGEAFPERSEPVPTTGQQVESPERKTIPPVPGLTPEQAEVVDEEAVARPPSEEEQEGAPEAPAPGMQSPALTPVPETFPKGAPKGAPADEKSIQEDGEAAAPPPPEPAEQEPPAKQPVPEEAGEAPAPAPEEEQVALARPVTLSVPANVDLAYGRQLYNTACIVCHEPGVAGAPRLGDKEAWESRLAKGWETLVEHAIHGFNAMPPKGGLNVPDKEIISAVGYMVSEAQ